MRRNGCYCDERQRQRKSRPVEEKLMQSLPQAMRENSSTLIGCFYKAPPVTSTQHALGSMEAECTRFTDEIYPHREITALFFSVFAIYCCKISKISTEKFLCVDVFEMFVARGATHRDVSSETSDE